MIDQVKLLKTMRRVLWVVATSLGSMGVMALVASFRIPDCGIDAFLMLGTATLIHVGLPQAPPAPNRRA